MGVLDSRLFAYGAMVLVVGAVVSPVIASRPKDGFPLSTYPMFARNRGRDATLSRVVALLDTGDRVVLSPRYLGSRDVLQAESLLNRALGAGDGPSREVCGEIAARVEQERDLAAAREVLVLRLKVDTIDWFVDADAATRSETVVVRCPVGARR